MTDQLMRVWRSALRWPYTKQGMIVLGCVVLGIGVLGVYEFVNAGGAIFIVCSVILFVLVIREWVRLYRHRNEPDWPRPPAWVSRNEPQPGSVDKLS
ncbi:hypothetical protein [Mycobacterium noviomagense]|nr:hypothetical protein [Mycobacterium noviomagense]BBY06346.1 hypothetical protein MNVI_16640 [Mycobacterium noviomagense]